MSITLKMLYTRSSWETGRNPGREFLKTVFTILELANLNTSVNSVSHLACVTRFSNCQWPSWIQHQQHLVPAHHTLSIPQGVMSRQSHLWIKLFSFLSFIFIWTESQMTHDVFSIPWEFTFSRWNHFFPTNNFLPPSFSINNYDFLTAIQEHLHFPHVEFK